MRAKTMFLWAAVVAITIGAALYIRSPSTGGAALGPGKRSGPAVPVETQVVAAGDFKIRRRTIGILESPAVVNIRSRIDSLVLQQHVTDGQIVRQGDLLFTLDDREIQATIARDQATIARDQATLAQAEAALERTQELISRNVAPRQQLEQATATFKAAQQTVEAGQAVLQADQLRLGYAKLTAPMNGRIGVIRVAPGNLVSANDGVGLVTLTQMQPLRVSFTLPERDLPALRRAAERKPPPAVRIYAGGEAEPLATGILDFVDNSVDTGSGTIAAKATFPNENYKLRPGQYVDVEIDLETRPNTVTVPTVAILTGQSGPYVFVAKDDGAVEIRKVELAGVEGSRTAIGSGLKDGERVVLQGQLRLTPTSHWQEAKPSADAGVIKTNAKTPSAAKAADQ